MKFKSFICILSALLLVACATSRSIAKTNVQSIEFGYSGGFENQYTKRGLDYTGQLYEIADNQIKPLCRVDEEAVLALFQEASRLDEPIRDPGNVSYYIVVKKKNEEKKWVWNRSTSNVDALWQLYRKLNELK